MFSIEEFIKQYQNLANPDKSISQEANKYILKLQQTKEAFTIAQQILDQQNIQQEYQFIACQLIYRRLKEECDITIQPYLLTLLGRPLSNIALNQVCSSFAVIIVGNSQLWKGILQELIQLMKVKMPIGIEILNQIAIQSKECHSKRIIEIATRILDTRNLLCVQDLNIFKQTISCIESWVQFSYNLFKDSKLIQQIIVLIQHALQNNALEYSDKLFSLLYEAVAYSQYIKSPITEPIVQQNLIAMLEFIIKIYSPQISVMFASFATKFICDFYPIVQNSKYEEPVLTMMVNIVNNPQRKIVFQTFEFWSLMRQNNLLQGIGLKILQCLIDRCKVKSIKLTKQFLSGESEDENDFLLKQTAKVRIIISLLLILENIVKKYSLAYIRVLNKLIKRIHFQIILSNLVITNAETSEQIIQSEAALFCLCSIIDEADFQIDNPLVLQIIQFVLQLSNSQNFEIIVKTTLQMFSGLTNQLNLNNELLLSITKYFFQYMLHPLLGSLAGIAFEQICNNGELKNQQLISDCVLFLDQHFNDFINQSQLSSFVEGILKLCYRIYSQGNIDCIIQLFNFANNQFQLFNNISLLTKQQFTYITTLIIAILTWINSNIEEISPQVKQISDLLCSSISEPLINLFKEQQGLSNNDELYQLVRMIMKVSNYQTHSQSIISLLQISFQIFYQNPIQKHQWLQLITIAIGRSSEFQFISQWAFQSSQQIHQFCIEQFKHWRDSDLMKVYVEFVKECTRYCQQTLFQSPYLFLIIEVICEAFLTLNSYEMQREILQFFKTLSQFIEKGQDYFNQIVIQIVTTLFLSISNINRAIIFQIIQILQFILKRKQAARNLRNLSIRHCLKVGVLTRTHSRFNLQVKQLCTIQKDRRQWIEQRIKIIIAKSERNGEEEIDYMHLEMVIKQ